MINTLLFDLDNTLYPASSELTRVMDTRITDYIGTFLGVTCEEAGALRREYYAQYGMSFMGLRDNHALDVEDYLTYVHDIQMANVLVVDAELDRLLGEIRATKAIFTNSPREHAERVLAGLHIAQHFDQIFDLRFFAFQPKPHPEAYQRVLDTLGAAGSQTVLLEDSPRNLPPAKALGMTTILIDEPGQATPDAADYVVPNVLEALRLIVLWEQETT